jgi:hypothetical protein
MSTTSTCRLGPNPFAVPMAVRASRQERCRVAIASICRHLRLLLPRIGSHRNAMLDLAEAYESMARRAEARGDLAGSRCHLECGRRIRERTELQRSA